MSRKRPLKNRYASPDYAVLEPRQMLTTLPAFPNDPSLYQIYSNYGRTGEIDLVNQTFNVSPMEAGTKVNGAGYRNADNYAYGIFTNTYQVARIGADGSTESVGSVAGLPQSGSYYVGDFAEDGLLYVRGSSELNKLYGINVDTLTVDNTITTNQHMTSIYDIAYNNVDDKFYASQRGAENKLISIDLSGNVETIGLNGIQKLTFGAMYADADGNVFGAANQNGEIYRFDTNTGEGTLVGRGPKSGTNDGFSNASITVVIPPLANDDTINLSSVSTSQGNLITGSSGGQDVDGNFDPLSVTAVNGDSENVGELVQLKSGSEIRIESDGSYYYKPAATHAQLTVNQSADESFTYTIADPGGETSTATVTISVAGVLDSHSLEGIRVTGLNSFGGGQYLQVSQAGDVNNDGHADAIVASYRANQAKGASFLIFGDANGIAQNFNVNQLRSINGNDGSRGVIFHGANSNDLSGYSYDAAGDVNGDGIDDLIIGAKDADPNGIRNAGAAYVVFGKENGWDPEFQLSDLLTANGGDGSEGFVLQGIHAHDLSGGLVRGIGDVNGDGLDDIAVAAKFADVDSNRRNAGQTYVVFGSENGFDAQINLAAFTAAGGNNGDRGFAINGIRKHDLAGSDISAGDVNGDGINDILLTATLADSLNQIDSGQSYLIYGSTQGFGAELELASILKSNGGDGTKGIAINGSSRGKKSGGFVSMTDDLNSDGKADLTIGIRDWNSREIYVVDGGSEQLESEFEIANLYKDTTVLLDNFDQRDEVFEDRDWDQYSHNVTLHSNLGTQVTIWGDPHVIYKVDGQTHRFNIGLGLQSVQLSGGATVSWDTVQADPDAFPLGPPLKWISFDTDGTEFDHFVDVQDETNFTDFLTGFTEGQLREFGRALFDLQI